MSPDDETARRRSLRTDARNLKTFSNPTRILPGTPCRATLTGQKNDLLSVPLKDSPRHHSMPRSASSSLVSSARTYSRYLVPCIISSFSHTAFGCLRRCCPRSPSPPPFLLKLCSLLYARRDKYYSQYANCTTHNIVVHTSWDVLWILGI